MENDDDGDWRIANNRQMSSNKEKSRMLHIVSHSLVLPLSESVKALFLNVFSQQDSSLTVLMEIKSALIDGIM